ncbi:DUF305 domain-containing protein [Microbacterium sp. SY138]|uniref:DUF305 domain-containing protein n=1 Tax=unclassified Microbacterium TaxID=2609290 RepID=UPI00321B0EC4
MAVVAVGSALVLAFAVGRFSASGGPPTIVAEPNRADVGFARDMQVHHAQAVEMAMISYRDTTDDELRVLAYDIATAQAGQRGEMFGWLVSWGRPQAGEPLMTWMGDADTGQHHGSSGSETTADREAAMGMATSEEIAQLQQARGDAQDCLFLDLMIRHHRGAIEMSDAVVELGADPRLLDTAKQISQNQSAEIAAMTDLQKRLNCG